jgi:hypothetical protein
MVSERTKACRRNYILLTIIHILCLLGPFFYFVPYIYITGATTSKVVVTLAVTLSLIFAGISLLIDVKHRGGIYKSIFWILIAAITAALTAVKTFVVIMAIVSIVDELIICPLCNKTKTALIANKEIDKR